MIRALGLALISIPLLALAPQDSAADKKIWANMEARINTACIKKTGDAALCACIQGETREKMPQKDYHFILEAINSTENLDMDALRANFKKYNFERSDFEQIAVKLQLVEDAAEEKCEAVIAQVSAP